jgi:hypothetical protein
VGGRWPWTDGRYLDGWPLPWTGGLGGDQPVVYPTGADGAFSAGADFDVVSGVAEEVAGNDPGAFGALERLVRGTGDREERKAREREAFVDLLSGRAGDVGER